MMRSARASRISYKEASDSESDQEEHTPPKRKLKRKNKPNGKKKEEEEEEGGDYSSESEVEIKKRKKQHKKQKGKKGVGAKPTKVNQLGRLPNELFLEILSLLSPKDLLHLARTNKDYRSFFMSKEKSESIWKKSFARVQLPELEADDWSLPACAHMVFTTHCYECGRYAPSWIDPWLRRRLCKPCRKILLMKLTQIDISKSNLHPLIYGCVVGSHRTPGARRRAWGGKYALVTDIDEINAQLLELQEQDQPEIEDQLVKFSTYQRHDAGSKWIKKKKSSVDTPQSRGHSGPQTPAEERFTRTSKSKEKSYREEEEEEIDENLIYHVGPRVKAFVKSREEYVDTVEQDGLDLALVATTVASTVLQEERMVDLAVRARAQHIQNFFDPNANSRRLEIKRHLGLVEGYEEEDIRFVSQKAMVPFLEGEAAIDDEEWKKLQPKFIALVDSGKEKKARKDANQRLFEAEADRKNSLRDYYDQLLDNFTAGQFPPLFEDFLNFDTVKRLWIRQDENALDREVDDSEWSKNQEAIEAECEEYHVDLLDKAVRLILSTTEEFATEDELEEKVQKIITGDLDSFFDKATSLLFCDAGCETKTRFSRPSHWNGFAGGQIKKKKGAAFFGTLSQIIDHQLDAHNDFTASKVQTRSNKRAQDSLPFRLNLPLEVASLVSDFVDILTNEKLTKGSVKFTDLNQLCKLRLHGGNTLVYKVRWNSTWRNFIERVYNTARKASRARPPINLPPPEVNYSKPYGWKSKEKEEEEGSNLSSDSDSEGGDSDDEDQDGAEDKDEDEGEEEEGESD
ncbi:hypothetical protein JCM3765_003656 [Sporobolomyces pararoseus]